MVPEKNESATSAHLPLAYKSHGCETKLMICSMQTLKCRTDIKFYPFLSMLFHFYSLLSSLIVYHQSISSWKPSWLRPRLCFSRSFGLDQMLPAFYQRWVASLLEQAYIIYCMTLYIYIMILNNIISYHVSYIIYIWYVIYYILYIIYYILYIILYIYIIIYYMLYIIYYIL